MSDLLKHNIDIFIPDVVKIFQIFRFAGVHF